jgi:MoaA/NifB/PqqE/SkfB family radical SAM enzyme
VRRLEGVCVGMRHLFYPAALVRNRLTEARASITHCTWDPKGTGVIRLHLVPPKPGLRRHDSLLYINGQHIIPLNHGEAALLRTFINELVATVTPGQEVAEEQMRGILGRTAEVMHRLYPAEAPERFVSDLGHLQDMISRVAFGKEVPELAGRVLTLAQYAPQMRAPMRMDLAVMPMRIDNQWACPLACTICYAAKGEAMQVQSEEILSTTQWQQVLDRLWQIGVPQISFTGGDPLARPDIASLVAYGQQFITRLNTSAVLLTPDLAQQLYEANLDVMQVTVYAQEAAIHDKLVGKQGALEQTLTGIKLALAAGIQVSVNTPLVAENLAGYPETLAFLFRTFGLRYFTASGMLPAGGAVKKIAAGGAAAGDELFETLRIAKETADQLGCELDFTSPGCLDEAQLASLGLNTPTCGACLGNMAIAPDGEVLPCQSWVHQKQALGNILTTPWPKIWEHSLCRRIRKTAALKNDCPLGKEVAA